jgi:phosphoribosyl 1,2-cyclic phosphodiesterase
MSLFVCSLNSGSNGNCYYIGNDTDAVLVDAGISCRETEKRMKRLGLAINKIRAIFISHEHADHINGLPVLSQKYKLPVYITPKTLMGSRVHIEPSLLFSFNAYHPVQIGELQITAFPKFHDAADPHSFIIANKQVTIGVFTDIGICCEPLRVHFEQCDAAFLEANYDTAMLANGSYPAHLKKRIMSGKGHLSNDQALELFNRHRPAHMTHLFLSHLSKNNNHPKLAGDLFETVAANIKIIIASRDKETPLFHITGNGQPKATPKKIKLSPREQQLSLF